MKSAPREPPKDQETASEKRPGRIFRPFPLGECFMVFPPEQVSTSGGRIPLILGPGRAFGSGEHETTASCIEFLEQIPLVSKMQVLDFGCGTGILSLAAARLGASHITALDNDPEALEACLHNRRLNGLEKQILCLEGDLTAVKGRVFDLILANIYDDIIIKNSRELAGLGRNDGYLLLSGITYEGHFEVKSRLLMLGFKVLKDRMMEDYCTLLLQKNRFPKTS